MDDAPIGVLLMALGGPDSLEAVAPFLQNVRGGRPTPDSMVEEFRERYRRIGGKSPLLAISLAQTRALEARLNDAGPRFRMYLGMRHWSPYIRAAVAHMRDDRVCRAVALCLTPYFSRLSVGAYFTDFDDAMAETSARIRGSDRRWKTSSRNSVGRESARSSSSRSASSPTISRSSSTSTSTRRTARGASACAWSAATP